MTAQYYVNRTICIVYRTNSCLTIINFKYGRTNRNLQLYFRALKKLAVSQLYICNTAVPQTTRTH